VEEQTVPLREPALRGDNVLSGPFMTDDERTRERILADHAALERVYRALTEARKQEENSCVQPPTDTTN